MERKTIRIHFFPRLLTSKGELSLGPDTPPVELAEDKLVIWIDLDPTLRFAHPTRTVLIGAEKVEVYDGQWWLTIDGHRFPEPNAGCPSPIAPLELGETRVHVLPRVFEAGEVLMDHDQEIPIKEPSIVVWIDLLPTAKFAHPTRYVLMSAHDVRVVEGQWWPTMKGRPVLGLTSALPQPWELEHVGNEPPGEPELVDEVLLADVAPVKIDRRRGSVTAFGRVPTAGYTDARLNQRIYIVDPGDDMIDFEFTARPPGEPAAQQVSEVIASHDVPLQTIAGVRVFAERNHLTLHVPMISSTLETRDSFAILAAEFAGDQLVIQVRYGGGCRRHDFRVLWDGSFRKSNPPQVDFLLTHDGHRDPCKALIHETLRVDMLDLPPVVVHLRDGFGFEQQLRYRLPAI